MSIMTRYRSILFLLDKVCAAGRKNVGSESMPGRQRGADRFFGPELASLRNSPHPLRSTKPCKQPTQWLLGTGLELTTNKRRCGIMPGLSAWHHARTDAYVSSPSASQRQFVEFIRPADTGFGLALFGPQTQASSHTRSCFANWGCMSLSVDLRRN